MDSASGGRRNHPGVRFQGKSSDCGNGNDLQGWIQLKNSSMNRVIF